MSSTRGRLLWLWGALLLFGGCVPLNVSLQGTVQTRLVEPAASTPSNRLVLAFDRLGNLTLNGELLDLPMAREHKRFGISVVDAGALPPLWRPQHAAKGGVMVASLHKASPLAIAGLRPFDLVERLDGKRVADIKAFTRKLDRAPNQKVSLEIRGPEALKQTLTARASEGVSDSTKNWVPFLFDRRSSSTGHALGIGPLDALFGYRSHTKHHYLDSKRDGHSIYLDSFEWSALFGLIAYSGQSDPGTGNARSKVRLLWFITLGDDS